MINKDDETLIEGIRLINQKYPFFNLEQLRDLESGQYYSLDMILEVLQEVDLIEDFLKIVIFDFLTGNSDRHQSNWALLENSDEKKILCPIYDNGSSLCSYISEENIPSFLGNDYMRFTSLVNTKSRSRIRVQGDQKKEATHLEVISYIAKAHRSEGLNRWVDQCIQIMNDKNIDNLIYHFDGNEQLSKEKN